jgi:thymidylate synthase ThyX
MTRICNEPAEITIPEIKDSEVSAMTQAMYSRSNTRIKVRLEELDKEGEEKAKASLSSYYLGYGHSSINDCGFTTIYIEGVSNIAAKAIEDTQLFNGQESSTRYLDYSKQSIIDPYDKPESREIIEGWLSLYIDFQPLVVEGLKRRFPKGEDEDQNVYDRAIKARSFDIMRGYLPSGVTTQLSWTTSLRHARDRIRFLKYHPCQEVRDIIKSIHSALLEKYPNSFKATDIDVDEKSEEYSFYSSPDNHYFIVNDESIIDMLSENNVLCFPQISEFNMHMSKRLAERPANCNYIPTMFDDIGRISFLTYLDFGSYRDLQRHRNGFCPIPLVKEHGFGINKWYVDETLLSLTENEKTLFSERIGALHNEVDELIYYSGFSYDQFKHQYLYPLSTNIITEFTYTVRQCIYVSELRSKPTVHETLRPLAQAIGNITNKILGYDTVCRINNDASAFDISRGKQTIFKDGKEIE